MMRNKRYIPTKALKTGNSKYVPFWELKYQDSEDYGEGFAHEDNYQTFYNDLIDCYWDTKEHKLLMGIVHDVYPKKTAFVKDEEVYVEIKHGYFTEDKIVEIKYEDYESNVRSIRDTIMHNDLDYYFSKKEQSKLNPNGIYEFRNWSAYYLLESGKLIKWDHQLKHKHNE